MRRKVDALGRVILPAEYREALHIREDDKVEMVLRPNGIHITKAVPRCVFCDGEIALAQLGYGCACRSCVEKLYEGESFL